MTVEMSHIEQGVGFHAQDGWFFRRRDDGGVCIRQEHPSGVIMAHMDVDDATWGSIVCSVSVGGEVRGRWYTAMDFHAGKSGDREGYA